MPDYRTLFNEIAFEGESDEILAALMQTKQPYYSLLDALGYQH